MTQTLEGRVVAAMEAALRRTKEEHHNVLPHQTKKWVADVPDAGDVATVLEQTGSRYPGQRWLYIPVPGTEFEAYGKIWLEGRCVILQADGSVVCYMASIDPADGYPTSEDIHKQALEIRHAKSLEKTEPERHCWHWGDCHKPEEDPDACEGCYYSTPPPTYHSYYDEEVSE